MNNPQDLLIMIGFYFMSVGFICWGIRVCLKNEGFEYVGALLILIGLFIGGNEWLSNSEITAEQYTELATSAKQGKLSKGQIDEAISDGKITNKEYRDLVESLNKKTKKVEMNNAKQQLRDLTK